MPVMEGMMNLRPVKSENVLPVGTGMDERDA